jgi:membrane protein YdbS with pleckstrin-like domain
MPQKDFTPHPKYQIKMLVSITLIALLILLAAGILAILIGFDDLDAGLATFAIVFFCDLLFWLVGMILSIPYFRSLRYEILEDEVIVHVGIITHSVKHVPYRTVTNITVKRDILDRWFFKLGSLNIQTAGMSGQSGAEEKLVGMENVQEIYEIVVSELRRFRGVMPPTAGQGEPLPDVNAAMLEEVQTIRRLLEEEKG